MHLSDLHFGPTGNEALVFRAREVAHAALGNVPAVDAVMVIATGDFIDKGDEEAFGIASMFFDDLKSQVISFSERITYVGEVVVPGNHDMIKPKTKEGLFARSKALEDLLKRPQNFHSEDAAISVLLSDLGKFFQFDSARTGRNITTSSDRLAWTLRFEILGQEIQVNVINTAWMTNSDQDQGNLLAIAPNLPPPNPGAFNVVALHHPFNWLHRDNARSLQRAIGAYADLILSGHEHSGQTFVRHGDSNEEALYFEGEALAASATPSGFAALAIDFSQQKRQTMVYCWDGAKYIAGRVGKWCPVRHSLASSSDGFVLTDEFEKELDEHGLATETAPYVRLEDVFVYPRLRDVTLTATTVSRDSPPAPPRKVTLPKGLRADRLTRAPFNSPKSTLEPVFGALEVLAKTDTNPRLLIIGDDRCGKTTLLRRFYRDLRAMNLVPVLLKAKDLRLKGVDKLNGALRQRAESQYGQGAGERFIQLPLDQRVIICDDLHTLDATSSALRETLRSLESLSKRTILAGDELFILRQIWASFGDRGVPDYRVYKILELDLPQQNELASKLSQTLAPSVDPDHAGDELNRLERNLASIIGDQTVTAYPGDVKLIITDLIQQQHQGAEYGAYGFFYDRLIKNDIASGLRHLGKDAAQLQADTILQFLSELAIYMHGVHRTEVNRTDIGKLVSHFRSQGHKMDENLLVTSLLKSRMLVAVDDGYRFREKYQRYFFLASHLRDLLAEDESRDYAKAILEEFIETINLQESADVILFTVYLTRSKWLLTKVLKRAKEIMTDVSECDLENLFVDCATEVGDTNGYMFQDVQDGSPEMVATDSDYDLDEFLLNTLRKMNEAFNTLNVIGQVLRNYPARIDLDVRERLVGESYGLGLRALSTLINLVNVGRTELDMLARRHLRLSGKGILQAVDPARGEEISARLVTMCSYGIIRRIVLAIASPHLEPVLDTVGKTDARTSMRLARTGVLLDLRKLTNEEVRSLYASLRNNQIARAVLRQIVVGHLRTFRALHPRKAALCAAVEVDPDNPRLFGTPDKPRRVGRR